MLEALLTAAGMLLHATAIFAVLVLVFGKEFADTLAQQFDEDLTRSKERTLEDERQLSLGTRIARSGARLLSPLM